MNIEVFLVSELEKILNVPVHAERPENPPMSFVVVGKTGSGGANRLESATVTVQSYGSSKYKAMLLNELVKEAMIALEGSDEISKIRLNSDYPFADEVIKRHRYQAVFDIYHY